MSTVSPWLGGDGGAGPHSATGCSDGGHWSSRTRRPGQRGALLYPHQQSVIRLVTIQSCEGVYWFVDMMIHHCLPGPWGKVIYYTKRQQDQTWHITVCCVRMWVCWMLVLIPSFAPTEMSIAHFHTSPDAGYMGDGDHLHCLFVSWPLHWTFDVGESAPCRSLAVQCDRQQRWGWWRSGAPRSSEEMCWKCKTKVSEKQFPI